MAKILVIDGGNVMHKAIFAVISQIKSEMIKVAKEQNKLLEDNKIHMDDWWNFYNIVMNKNKNREIFIMNPTTTYIKMLVGYLKKIGYNPKEDTIYVAQDYGKSWRKLIDVYYKQQRKELREQFMPSEWWAEIYEKFNKFYEKLDRALPWYFLSENSIEADDWASIICKYYHNRSIILISGDADWQMLCYFDGVKIFSPYSKKYKIVKNPMKVLLEKIQGDISDNLLTKPSSELEFEKRKQIVNLIELPKHIDALLRDILNKLTPKKINLVGLAPSIQKNLRELYNEK